MRQIVIEVFHAFFKKIGELISNKNTLADVLKAIKIAFRDYKMLIHPDGLDFESPDYIFGNQKIPALNLSASKASGSWPSRSRMAAWIGVKRSVS